MIVVYDRNPDDTEYHAVAKWQDGEWVEGAELMRHIASDVDAERLLDRFGGPGTRTAMQFDDPSEAPESFDPTEEQRPTIELDGSNWMDHDRDVPNDEPPEELTPIEEMTEEEIRRRYDADRAETIIKDLEERGVGVIGGED